MKLLKTIKHSDLFPGSSQEGKKEYRLRKAARAVVFDNDEKIAILKVADHDYHKLPGGGVEGNEDLMGALEREIVEEIGCRVSVTGELGKITEYRVKYDLKQESYCYLAKIVGKKGKPSFTKEEISSGFEVSWVTLDKAIELIKKDTPDNYEGKFIKVRDLSLLEEAQAKLTLLVVR